MVRKQQSSLSLLKGLQFIIAFTLILGTSSVFSQGIFKGSYWKKERKELSFGIGASNFLGELGGRDQIGSDFVQDLEFSETKYVFNAAYRYFLRRDLSWKNGVYYGLVSGDDAKTSEKFRNLRNLHFRSQLIEVASLLEYHLLEEKTHSRYKIRGARGIRQFVVGLYAFTGVAFTYFNSQAKYTDGNWYNLRPLSTEGQGLDGGSKTYAPFTFAIPYGLGLRYAIDSRWRLGLELGARKTFSDYIDDVGGKYYDPEKIRAAKGDVAAYFSNPAKDGLCENCIGEVRGDDKDKDAYMFAVLEVNYKLIRKRGKYRRIKSRRSIPSF